MYGAVVSMPTVNEISVSVIVWYVQLPEGPCGEQALLKFRPHP